MGYFSRTRPADIRVVSLHNRDMPFNNPDYCCISGNSTQVTSLSPSISTPGCIISNTESSTSNKENMDPGCLSSSSYEGSHASVLYFPVLPHISCSTTEVFSFSLDHNSEPLSVPVDSLLTSAKPSTDITESEDIIHAATEHGSRGDEPALHRNSVEASSICSPRLAATSSRTFNSVTTTIDLTESSYTGSENVTNANDLHLWCSLKSPPVIPELREANLVEQASPEPTVTSSLSSDTFNKVILNTLPFKDTSATAYHLTICPVTSDQSLSSLTESQEIQIRKQIHLQTNNVWGSGEEPQLVAQELVIGSEPTPGHTDHSELESRTLINDLQSVTSANNDLYDLFSKPGTERRAPERDPVVENPVKVVETLDSPEYEVELSPEKKWRGKEYFARNQQTDTVEEVKYEAEKMLESFVMTKKKPQNAEVNTMELHVEVEQSETESEAVEGKVFCHLPDLATPKPDVPVQQARVSQECEAASPWSPNRDASVTGRSQATCLDLAVGSRPYLPSGWLITQQVEAARGGADGSAVSLHKETEGNSAPEHTPRAAVREDTCTLSTVSTGEQDLHEPDSGPLPDSWKTYTEETTVSFLSIARGTLHWAPESEVDQDTGRAKAEAAVTSSAYKGPPVHSDKEQQGGLCDPRLCSKNAVAHGIGKLSSNPAKSTYAAGVIVYIREFSVDKSGKEEDSHCTGASVLLNCPSASAHMSSTGRFSHTFPVLSTVTEESDTESLIEAVPGPVTEMSSGFTLTLRPKVGQDFREDLKRVHKVSLVGDNRDADSSEPLPSTAQANGLTTETEENSTSSKRVQAWSFLRKDVHSIPEESESPPPDQTDTVLVNNTNTYTHSSLFRTTYEPVLFSSYSLSPEAQWKPPPSAVSLDTDSSPGNSSRWNMRSEVQQGSESEAGGRSWVELSAPAGGREEDSEAGGRSWVELSAPAGGREEESEAVITNAGLDLHTESGSEHTDDFFSGVFTATRVELPPSPIETDPGPSPTPALGLHKFSSNMEALVDTLRSKGPLTRSRPRASSQTFSSLPPIREDTPSPAPVLASSPTDLKEPPVSLPPDLGLNWSSVKDMRSPLTMMKEQLCSEGTGRTLILPSRTSAISSIVMRKSSLPDLCLEEGTHLNGGSFIGSSRLDNSLLFSGYRPDQTDGMGKALGQRPLYRTASLPDVERSHERLSGVPKGLELLSSGSHYNRLSLFTSPPHSLTGTIEPSRISRATPLALSLTAEDLAPNGMPPSSLLLESPVKYPTPPSLQRSLSCEGSSTGPALNKDIRMDFSNNPEPRPKQQFVTKYRAFPDAYRTKEKEHGKLNPRPGKMLIFDQPGLRGQCIEVHADVIDATGWQLPEEISIRVVRGGWVLYEKPNFKGQKIALDEGDMELINVFGPQSIGQCPAQNGTGQSGPDPENEQPKGFVIGSLRRAVRDYSVPEICLFPDENAEGKKIIFRDTTDDARIYGFPIKANSIIINAGLWLVFAEPFFQGIPRVLEVGGFPNPASWSTTEPYVSSVHPLKIGEPRVEKPNEAKLVIYEKPYFTGKSREIYTSARDFMTRENRQQTVIMYNVGSIKVIGGIWVGYEKEGFRGHQYLLEEGDYHDWRVWGGWDNELRSVRVIQTDLSEPMLVMFEMPNEEEDTEEERTFEVTEAVPDVELFGFRPATRSIHVLSGVWVAYCHVDFSGNQYILEKGFYSNCIDWGAEDNHICSIQPILKLRLYSEPGFQGLCQVYNESHESLPKHPPVQSCRVLGESWVLYDDTDFTGNQYVLSEGEYVNLTSMGCSSNCSIRSVKAVSTLFAVPSISLFGLECFEGREITLDTEVSNMMAEGFNPHFLSVRVNTGCWVLCEYTNYRGRQFLLEPIEITNWHKFSSLSSVGSIYPVRAKRRLFRIRYKESGCFMSVQGGVDTKKSGRVVVSDHVEGISDVWFYQDGLIKNKLAQNMSLQVMGNVESGAKVVLWSETRTPIQMWSAKLSGPISSLTFPGFVLDVKGGNTYDKEHVIVRNQVDENVSELWEVEFI